MSDRDDVMLVRNALKECLELAGENLHPYQEPSATAPREGDYITSAAMGRGVSGTLQQAQFWLARHQLLTALGIDAAARYLREEMLDALTRAKEQEEISRATPKQSAPWSIAPDLGVIAVTSPSSPGFGVPGDVLRHLQRQYLADQRFYPYRSAG